MSEKIKDRLEISEEELEQAEMTPDRSIEKVFGNKVIKIMVFSVPGYSSDQLMEIKRKIENREGLDKKERQIAIKAGLIDKDQEWFSTLEWQQGMKESEEDLKAGRYKESDNIDDLIADLNKSL